MRPIYWISLFCFAFARSAAAQTPERSPDVSNKALITKSTPAVSPAAVKSGAEVATLRKLAEDYYNWRNQQYPVRSSDAGLHTWDDRLTDYSPGAIAAREKHTRSLLDKVRAMKVDAWPKDDQIDWLLFRSQLEEVDFETRILKSARTDPQLYIGVCMTGIFSLLKKEYDTPQKRAVAATARFKQMP
ncbi:MAG TPA: hypothetical protein VJ719_05875, partial [Chthoniobacterales bacterium]|nr:hypothetical protein [Chthoniobacterales bacterium]